MSSYKVTPGLRHLKPAVAQGRGSLESGKDQNKGRITQGDVLCAESRNGKAPVFLNVGISWLPGHHSPLLSS